MAWDLAATRTYLQDRNRSDTATRAVRMYDKISNDARMELSRAGRWDFDKRLTTLTFAARYNTGTVSINAAGTALTGVDTVFTSAMDERFIRLNGENILYRITAFVS